MSYNYPSAIPTLIPGDINVRTTRVSTIYPTQTVGPYTTWKLPVKVATTANISLEGLFTVDGIALSCGDRSLVKNQTNSSDNGIYTVFSTLTVADFWIRTQDLPEGSSAANMVVFVNEGTVNADIMFICTNSIGSDIVGTDDLTYSTYGTPTSVVPGGTDSNVQYNSSGAFAGSSLFTFNPTFVPAHASLSIDVLGTLTLGSTDYTKAARFTSLDAITSSGNDGQALIITGGNGDGVGYGGYCAMFGGYSTNGQGGELSLRGGQSAAGTGGDVNLTGGSGTVANGNVVVNSNNKQITFINGGIEFEKDILSIGNLSSPPTITSTSRQGIISITDPSAVTAGSSITITVNNVNVLTSDNVYVCIQQFTGNGIPMVLVSSVTLSTGFTIILYNLDTVNSFSASQMQISFIMM